MVSASANRAGRLRRASRYIYKNRWMYLILLPGVLYYLIFNYLPMYGIVLAFKDFSFKRGVLGSAWVGFEHFQKLFALKDFWEVTRNTMLISFYRLLVGMPAAPLFALLLNELTHKRFKRVMQTVSYFPHFISWVVVYGMFYRLLSADGLVNTALAGLGLEPVRFLSSAKTFRSVLVLTGLWKEFGWSAIIYLAAIASVDGEQIEAAIIDGANRFQRIVHIIVPCLRNAFATVLILSLSGIMNGGFDQVFIFYNELVYSTGDILDTYIYRIGLQNGKYDMATAVGLLKSIIGFVLLVGANQIARKVNEVGLY